MADSEEPQLVVMAKEDFRHVSSLSEDSHYLIMGLANGMTNQQLANYFGMSRQSLKNKLQRLYDGVGIPPANISNPRVVLAWWWWHVGVNTPVRPR